MHILFFTDNFPPEVNAPASRTFEHARVWVELGHQVTVITCVPNFPTGKAFEGYKNRPWQSESLDGIRVVRVWSYIAANTGFLRRTLDFISYMVTSFLASFFIRRVDVIIGTSPQFFTVCSAWLASVFKRRPWVFELRDIWPESIRAVGALQDSRFLDLMEKLELFLYRRSSLIVTVTKSFKVALVSRGIDAAKIVTVTNGVDLAHFKPIEKDPLLVEELGLEGKFIAGYIGTHGMAHALGTVLDAATLMLTENPSVVFILLGAGAEKANLQAIANERNLTNVIFIDPVPKDQVARYWSVLDAAIIHLKRTPLFKTVIPSKLFECMAMGIPVLHGVEGESAEIVLEAKAGTCFIPEEPDDLKSSLLKLESNKPLRKSLSLAGPVAAQSYGREQLARDMITNIKNLSRFREQLQTGK